MTKKSQGIKKATVSIEYVIITQMSSFVMRFLLDVPIILSLWRKPLECHTNCYLIAETSWMSHGPGPPVEDDQDGLQQQKPHSYLIAGTSRMSHSTDMQNSDKSIPSSTVFDPKIRFYHKTYKYLSDQLLQFKCVYQARNMEQYVYALSNKRWYR